MKQLIIGILIGSTLTGTVVCAGFYDSKGNVQAPAGSQQSFDYFRMRQQWLDQSALRRSSEELLRRQRLTPCAR